MKLHLRWMAFSCLMAGGFITYCLIDLITHHMEWYSFAIMGTWMTMAVIAWRHLEHNIK